MVTRILLLGGGYVGVWSARRLARFVRSRGLTDVEVTLVSASADHSFHGWTAEVLTGHVRPERARVPLARLLPDVEIVHADILRVDVENRTVAVATDAGIRTISYDELVIATGSHDDTERVPGLQDHGWSLKDPDGLTALRHHLSDVVARAAATADPVARERLLTVVVAGAGWAGIEAATAISQRLRSTVDAHPLLAGAAPRVVLAHSGALALPALRPRFSRVADYAVAQAQLAGVEIHADTRLRAVTIEGARLDGGDIRSATVVSTIGQSPVALPGLEAIPRDVSDRIVTNRYLAAGPGVWAGGDSAAVPHPSGRGVCPANALWAIYHGKRIGGNVIRSLQGRPPVPFRFPGLGQGASLGVGRGAAELYGISLTGWPAWLARWAFFHWFMPSRRIALATAAEWFRGPVHEPVSASRAPVGLTAPAGAT